ncbi:MAG: hypothetical protein KAI64_06940 [Thermoplasmata archaeon]|nr:hypothetical protein [Thermoplasmata archaeon]
MLKDALENKQENETFERALGRAIRKEKGDFERYIKVIGETRELARKRRVTLVQAARILAKVRKR